ncbi:MAG: hypothetical protein M1609_13035 [Firmicutes bacterium]|nr:hypothetical protein [Bacillota bacterium]
MEGLYLKKLPGGIFFAAAAIYLVTTKPLDLITLFAVTVCGVMAGLALTRYSGWSVAGGGMLIAGSLLLQSVWSYWCLDCIRADLMILAGVIALSVMDEGRYKLVLRVLASVLAVILAAVVVLRYEPPVIVNSALLAKEVHTPPAGKSRLAVPEKKSGTEVKPEGPPLIEQPDTSSARAAIPGNSPIPPPNPERYVPAVSEEGRSVTLDAAERPVLFFSPSCGACLRAVEALVNFDPEGKRWVPVQTGGEISRGIAYLAEKGYRGSIFLGRWHGPVPTLLSSGEKGIYKTGIPEEMVRVVGGDAG